MKWWLKLCDKVVETITGTKNNAGNIGFRTNCMVIWFTLTALAMILAHYFCPSNWGIGVAWLLSAWGTASWLRPHS